MLKRMIAGMCIITMMAINPVPANAGPWGWLKDAGSAISNAANSASRWVTQASNDMNNALAHLKNNVADNATKSYFWAFDTGKIAGNWLEDTSLSVIDSFGPLFGSVVNGCPSYVQNNNNKYGTSVQYNLARLDLTNNTPELCPSTGGTKMYPVVFHTGNSGNLTNYLNSNPQGDVCNIPFSLPNLGINLSVSVPGIGRQDISYTQNALKKLFETPDLSGINGVSLSLTGKKLPIDRLRDSKIIKAACYANTQCLASTPKNASVAQLAARQAQCNAELFGNLIDLKVKFLARYDAKILTPVLVGLRSIVEAQQGGQLVQAWAQQNASPSASPRDIGYPTFRAAADIDGDGKSEFCRQIGSKIVCDAYNPTKNFTEQASLTGDLGYIGNRWFADVNGDGRSDYCREVGNRGRGNNASKIACNYSNSTGTGFGSTYYYKIAGLGYEGNRWFADVNGDHKADYCREVGDRGRGPNPSKIACNYSTGTGFGRIHYYNIADLGYIGSRWFVDVNGDGRSDYCREVGNRRTGASASEIACNYSNSTGTGFGPIHYRMKTADLGYLDARWFADVNNDGKADYCREVADRGSSTNPPRIDCSFSTSNGLPGNNLTSYPADLKISASEDIGYRHPRMFADFTGDGRTDYLRSVGVASARRMAVLELSHNQPPVADAGAVQTAESTGSVTSVTLDGSASSDPDGDSLTYAWSWTGGSATGATPTVNLANGNHSITLTVDDGKGNIATASTSVTVQDTIAPVITISPIAAVEATSASGSVVDVASHVTTTDVCGVSLNIAPVGTYALGSTTVAVTATDCAGNTTSATTSVTVQDTTAPTLAQPANITGVEATSASGAVATFSLPVSTDIVDATPSVACAPASGSTFAIGTTTVMCTATDHATVPNSTQVSFTVGVVDTTAPSITAPANLTIEATGNPNTVFVLTVPATTADAVGVSSVTNDALTNFPSGFPFGTSVVTWTATDAAGNSATATQNITVVDTTPPSLTVPANVTVEATGALTTVSPGSANGSDLFGPVTFSNDAPATFTVGTTTVNWTATDANSNSTSGTQTVTVTDTTAPAVTAPANVTIEATAPLTPVSLGAASASDLVDGTLTATPDVTGPFAPGVHTITWIATDAHSNTGTATQIVTVTDTTAPVITTPADINVEANAVSSTVAIGTATASDLVDGVVSVSNNAPATFPLGLTTVTYTSTDVAGNTATTTQNITVADTTAPVLSVPANVSIEANAILSTVALGTATATDIFGATVTNDAPATFPLGATTVTYTATDGNGLTTTGTQTVTVVDTTAPVVAVPADVSVEANAVLSTVAIGSATATDIFAVTITSDAPATYALGTTVVTWTATDANGNVSTTTQNVTVVDTTIPVLTVPANVSVEANAVLSTVAIGTATATDIFGATVSNNAPATFPLGTTVVTYTATDGNGLTSTATQTVTVVDTTAPALTLPADIVGFEATGPQTTVAIGTATATDIFNPVTIISDAPATYPLGTTVVTWTATDANGNVATGTQNVNVVDTTAPVVTTQLIPVNMSDDDEHSKGMFKVVFTAVDIIDPNPVIVAMLNGATVTNGQVVKLEQDDDAGVEFEHGQFEVKGMRFSLNVSATDASANAGNATAAFAFPPEHKDHHKKEKGKDKKSD